MLLLATLVLTQTATPPLQVLDAVTGAAVANAEVLGVFESKTPIWGETWWRKRWITDDQGLARLDAEDTSQPPYDRYVVRAPGYAIWSEEGQSSDTELRRVELHPAIPARIRLVDFLGRPLPLVHLGYCVGCGHTPDVASAITDRDGFATFDCVGDKEARDIADVYPVGPGAMTDYLPLSWDAAQSGGALAIASAGRTLRGHVLLHDGSPAAGWYLTTNHRHRGPWTEVDEHGGFTFAGLPADGDTSLIIAEPNGEHWTSVMRSRLGVERVIQLDEERWTDERQGPTGTVEILVNLEAEAESLDPALPRHRVPLEIWDPSTGWCEMRELTPGEVQTVELLPGAYEGEIGGKGSPFARRSLGRIVVTEGKTQRLEPRSPAPRFAILSVNYEGEAVAIHVRTGSSPATRLLKANVVMSREVSGYTGLFDPFAVPAEPFGLWIDWADTDRPSTRLRVVSSTTRDDGVELWSAAPDPVRTTAR